MKPVTGKEDFAMAKITLNKASRLQDSLRRKLATLPLKAETTLSIFGADPAAEIARRAGTLSAESAAARVHRQDDGLFLR